MTSAMTKDGSIWRLVGSLAERLDFEDLQLIDHWDADLCAIGIARTDDPARLVYVSTFRPSSYSYECEQAGPPSCEVTDGATFDQLVDIIQQHLGVRPIPRP